MRRKILLAPILGAILFTASFSEEKSAFGAGDLESSAPYGLTDSEKVLLKSKEEVNNLNKDVSDVKTQVSTLEEQMEGLRSVLDGTNERVNDMDRRLTRIENLLGADSNNTSVSSQIEQIQLHLNESQKRETSNNTEIKKVIQELGSLIDSINSNYVPKSELKKLEDRLNALESGKKISTKSTSKNSSLKGKSGKSIFNEAKKLYNDGDLDSSKEYFQTSIKKRYKPAYSNFMLGEISYKEKSWDNAIAYYKKSVELYDKASYLPKLLYHTAISFDKIGNTKNANKFYRALKDGYPDSKEAKASPDRK